MPKSEFRTKEPVNDVLLAVHLLMSGWNDSTHRYLATKYRRGEALSLPEIHIEHWGGGYGKCEYTDTDRIQVTKEVAEQLVADRWVYEINPRAGEPFHVYGGDYRLAERDYRDKDYFKLMDERREEAKKLFVPGTHSSWSSVLFDKASGWDRSAEPNEDGSWSGRWKYRIYFDFETPLKEKVRIFPSTGEVESSYQKTKQGAA